MRGQPLLRQLTLSSVRDHCKVLSQGTPLCFKQVDKWLQMAMGKAFFRCPDKLFQILKVPECNVNSSSPTMVRGFGAVVVSSPASLPKLRLSTQCAREPAVPDLIDHSIGTLFAKKALSPSDQHLHDFHQM